MTYNLTWEHADEKSLIVALAGQGLGDTLAEAWPKLKQKKAYDAERSLRQLQLVPGDVVAEIGSGVGRPGSSTITASTSPSRSWSTAGRTPGTIAISRII